MEIALSIGANCTEGDRLLKSLLKNSDALRDLGVAIPGPSRYRQPLRLAVEAEVRGKGGPRGRELFLRDATDGEEPRRLVMVHDNLISVPRGLFDGGVFYKGLEARLQGLRHLLRGDGLHLFLAIRHPAAYLQALAAAAELSTVSALLGTAHPEDVRWSEVVARIRASLPEAGLTVWCQEDAPLLWEQILRAMTDAPEDAAVKGRFDMLSGVLDRAGVAALEAAAREPRLRTAADWHDLIASLWDTHALPEEVVDRITSPDLSAEMVQRLGAHYDADVARIDAMEGVRMLLPFR